MEKINANEQLAQIMKSLTFPSQMKAGFSAPLVEMLMDLLTLFNVNSSQLFSPQ